MSNQRLDQYDRRRRREASLSSDSHGKGSRRKPEWRESEPSKIRDHEYDRRRQYRSRSPIDHRRDLRRENYRDSRSTKVSNRGSKDESEDIERRRRVYSLSHERPRREFRDKDSHSRHYDTKPHSISPRSRLQNRKEPIKQSEAYRGRSRSSSPRRWRQGSRDRHHVGGTKNRSGSPPRHRFRPQHAPLSPAKRSHAALPSQEDAFHGKPLSKKPAQDLQPVGDPPPEKQKPNYAPSGKLAAETNTVANTSIILKYNEPPAARLPAGSTPWRLYIFKGDSLLETLPLHTRSCWLFGRERLVVDCPIEHPSCSKQHAVIQFRYVEVKSEYGDKSGRVKPYIIDLESANGTRVNGKLVPESRYVELRSEDMITFGESSREYVLMLPPKDTT